MFDVVEALCASKGVRVEKLPTYSPDFNPIELSFHMLKSWVRRNMRLWITFNDFEDYIKFAIKSSGCDQYAEKHFRHCGYLFKGEVEGDELIF